MADLPANRSRSYLYLIAGVTLFVLQLIRLPGHYAAWQNNTLDTFRFTMTVIALVVAMLMIRFGWRMRRDGKASDEPGDQSIS
jgi:heme/copper-type cytochrome/quinol oxidase subunit 2